MKLPIRVDDLNFRALGYHSPSRMHRMHNDKPTMLHAPVRSTVAADQCGERSLWLLMSASNLGLMGRAAYTSKRPTRRPW